MSAFPAWANRYIGIEYEDYGRAAAGADCWGLVRMVLAEQAGIAVPSWSTRYETDENPDGLVELIGEQKIAGTWRRIAPTDERPLDLVELTQPVMAAGRWKFLPLHIGIVVIPGWLLHVERATAAVLVDYHRPPMRNSVVAFWRHRDLEDAA